MEVGELYKQLQELESDERIVRGAMGVVKKAADPFHTQSIEIIKGNEGDEVAKLWYKAYGHLGQALGILEMRLNQILDERNKIMQLEVTAEDDEVK